MILLRKKDNPEEIRDYRPISLIHNFVKMVEKCLVNRLAKLLDALVRPMDAASTTIFGRSSSLAGFCIQSSGRLFY